MTLAEWVIQQVSLLGCEHVFLVPGGEIDPLVMSLAAQSRIKTIIASHEEGAGFMADGYARTHNHLGVCLATGAAGAANLVPALLAASADRTKVLALTGGSAMALAEKKGFQDSGIDGMHDARLIKPVTRYSESCYVAEQMPWQWQAALQAIYGNLPGAAHLALPCDLQAAPIDEIKLDYRTICAAHRLTDTHALDAIVECYFQKTQIAVLAGRGAVLSEAQMALKIFVERYQIPFALTFAAKGLLPETHPLCLGMFGYGGHRRAIEALLSDKVEVLIVFGSSLNARDTLCWSKELLQNKIVIQIDLDASMLSRNYPANYAAAQGDCAAALDYLNQLSLPMLKQTTVARMNWIKSLIKTPLLYNAVAAQVSSAILEPGQVIMEVNRFMPDHTFCFIDSGVHRTFAGHYWLTKPGGKIIAATNIGPMGWAIPAAIGGKLAAPDHPVLVITGDGCMRMHGMELATAARYQIPVIFLISNNDALGDIYLHEKAAHRDTLEMTTLPDIDWVLFGRGLGVEGVTVRKIEDIPHAVKRGLAAHKPFIINAITNRDAVVPLGPYQDAIKELIYS